MADTSTHRLIIETIHKNWHNGKPFAIWEVRDRSGCATSSVSRVIKKLVSLKLLVHNKKGFQGRRYRTNVQWPGTAKQAIDHYVWARMLKM